MSKVVKSTKALRSVRNVTPAKQVKQTKQRATQKFTNAPAESPELKRLKAIKPDHMYYKGTQIDMDSEGFQKNLPAIQRERYAEYYKHSQALKRGDINGFYGLQNSRLSFSYWDVEALKKIVDNDRYYMNVTNLGHYNGDDYIDGNQYHITLSRQYVDNRLAKLLMSKYWEPNIEIDIDVDDKRDSDNTNDMYMDVSNSGILRITLKKLVNLKRTKLFKNKGGSRFFPYLNTTDIDLTEYQIISDIETQGKHVKEHCLISTLKYCGILFDQLESIRLTFDDANYYDHRELIKVTDIIGKTIELYMYESGRENQIEKVTYGNYEQIIRIASIENHFIEYKDTPYTEFSIKNYDEIKDLPNWKNIIKRKGDKYERSAKAKRITSLRLIKLLLDIGKFEKSDHILADVNAKIIEEANKVISVPDNISRYQRAYNDKVKQFKDISVFYANIFTIKTDHNHKPIAAVVCHKEEIKRFNEDDNQDTCVTNMLNHVTRQTKGSTVIYFNNLRYAYHMMKKDIHITNIVQKDASIIYCIKITHNGKVIELHDASKFIENELNTSESYEDQVKKFKKDMDQFATNIKKITNLSIHRYLSISSVSDAYAKSQGAYNGVYECGGILREYLGLANYGGRVAALESIRKKVINTKVQDLDANSLYPSAIVNISNDRGIPMGECKKITVFEKTDLDKLDYYVCTIKITKINKRQRIPFIPCRTDTNILQYLNEVPEDGHTLVVDRITLDDFIKYHQIEYQILDGVYWSNGFNKKLGQLMASLFKERQACTDSLMASAIKLLSNSVYGKCILKKYKNKNIVMDRGDRFNNYRYNHFNQIESYQKISDRQVIITKHNVDNNYTIPIVGIMTYSHSKKIMNEVMGLANDNDIRIYYQDTDSLHMDYSQISQLEELYEKETGKMLIGNQLGQFKNDYKMDGAVTPIYSKKSIFLAPKSYIAVLESTDKDGKTIESYHYRMKGINRMAMLYKANEEYGGKMDQFYEDLAQKKMEIILNPIEIDMYQYTPTGVRTRPSGQIKQVLEF